MDETRPRGQEDRAPAVRGAFSEEGAAPAFAAVANRSLRVRRRRVFKRLCGQRTIIVKTAVGGRGYTASAPEVARRLHRVSK